MPIPGNLESKIEPYFLKNDRENQAWIVSSSRKTSIQSDNNENFRQALRLGLNQDGSWLIVDLTIVTFTGDTAMRIMVEALRDAMEQGKGFIVVFPYKGMVHEIIQLAGLDEVLSHFFTLDDAIQYIEEQEQD